LRQELEQRQELAAGLRKQLAEAEANRPDTDSTRANRGLAEQDLEKLRQKTEGLDKELQQLQQEERDLQERKKSLGKAREDLAAQNKAIADLKNTLDQLKGENESLPEQISQLENMPLNRSSIVVNFTPEFKYETNRSPVNVALTESTVTPIREPYYEFSGLGTAILVSRVRKGAPADQAILAGSDFSKLLDGIDPQKQYIYLHVESSSYTTFLAVRDELEKRKLPWGWEPWEGLTTLVSSPGGGTPSGTTE
jgi:multidrug efflux pump subunit AcrA (membrane-fusion protein)